MLKYFKRAADDLSYRLTENVVHARYIDVQNGIEFTGHITREFQEAVVNEYQRLPLATRHYLRDQKMRFLVGSVQDDNAPDRAGEFFKPSQDDWRVHHSQSAGWYNFDKNRIKISQYVFDASIKPDVGQRPDMANLLLTQTWKILSYKRLGNTLRHEFGHAIDRNFNTLSDTREFQDAYSKDLAALGGIDGAREKGFGYFVQDDVGRKEAFADVWAELHGGGCKGRKILKAFPSCAQYVKDFQAKFEEAYQVGEGAVKHFRHDIHNPLVYGHSELAEADTLQQARALLAKNGQQDLLESFETLLTTFNDLPEKLQRNIRVLLADRVINASKGIVPEHTQLFTYLRQKLGYGEIPIVSNVRNFMSQLSVQAKGMEEQKKLKTIRQAFEQSVASIGYALEAMHNPDLLAHFQPIKDGIFDPEFVASGVDVKIIKGLRQTLEDASIFKGQELRDFLDESLKDAQEALCQLGTENADAMAANLEDLFEVLIEHYSKQNLDLNVGGASSKSSPTRVSLNRKASSAAPVFD